MAFGTPSPQFQPPGMGQKPLLNAGPRPMDASPFGRPQRRSFTGGMPSWARPYMQKRPFPPQKSKAWMVQQGWDKPQMQAAGVDFGQPRPTLSAPGGGSPPFGPPQPLDGPGEVWPNGRAPMFDSQGGLWQGPPTWSAPGAGVDPAQFEPRPPQVDEFGRPIASDSNPFMRPYVSPERARAIMMGMGDPSLMRPLPGTRPYQY